MRMVLGAVKSAPPKTMIVTRMDLKSMPLRRMVATRMIQMSMLPAQ